MFEGTIESSSKSLYRRSQTEVHVDRDIIRECLLLLQEKECRTSLYLDLQIITIERTWRITETEQLRCFLLCDCSYVTRSIQNVPSQIEDDNIDIEAKDMVHRCRVYIEICCLLDPHFDGLVQVRMADQGSSMPPCAYFSFVEFERL